VQPTMAKGLADSVMRERIMYESKASQEKMQQLPARRDDYARAQGPKNSTELYLKILNGTHKLKAFGAQEAADTTESREDDALCVNQHISTRDQHMQAMHIEGNLEHEKPGRLLKKALRQAEPVGQHDDVQPGVWNKHKEEGIALSGKGTVSHDEGQDGHWLGLQGTPGPHKANSGQGDMTDLANHHEWYAMAQRGRDSVNPKKHNLLQRFRALSPDAESASGVFVCEIRFSVFYKYLIYKVRYMCIHGSKKLCQPAETMRSASPVLMSGLYKEDM